MAPLVLSVELPGLFHPETFFIKERLHGCSAAAHFALMRPFRVVILQPGVQIGLQLVQRLVQFTTEGNQVELIEIY